MSIIDPDGFFNGDRLRRCSNLAQLHWPRLFLASNGFGRLEINYAKIIGRAYGTFKPVPSEADLNSYIGEYVQHNLLFLYEIDGQMWGQWDTQSRCLPRFKTASDRRSPAPPEAAYLAWKRSYLSQKTSFPKYFGNISEGFRSGVGVGVGVGVGDGKCLPRSLALTKPLDEWVELLYARHPKKKDKGLVGIALLSVLEKATDPESLIVEIDRRHALWARTNEWTERNGRFVPSLAQWIEDHGWTQRPDTELPPPKRWVEQD